MGEVYLRMFEGSYKCVVNVYRKKLLPSVTLKRQVQCEQGEIFTPFDDQKGECQCVHAFRKGKEDFMVKLYFYIFT